MPGIHFYSGFFQKTKLKEIFAHLKEGSGIFWHWPAKTNKSPE